MTLLEEAVTCIPTLPARLFLRQVANGGVQEQGRACKQPRTWYGADGPSEGWKQDAISSYVAVSCPLPPTPRDCGRSQAPCVALFRPPVADRSPIAMPDESRDKGGCLGDAGMTRASDTCYEYEQPLRDQNKI